MKTKAIYVHEISRKEIESLNLKPFLDRFRALPSASPDELLRYCDAVVLSISGYDEVEEELYAIAEVRSYFQELNRWWPYWLYFLHLKAEAAAIPVLSLLPTISAISRRGTGRVAARFEPSEMGELLVELFPPMNHLCDRVDLGEHYIERRTSAILRLFFGEEGLV